MRKNLRIILLMLLSGVFIMSAAMIIRYFADAHRMWLRSRQAHDIMMRYIILPPGEVPDNQLQGQASHRQTSTDAGQNIDFDALRAAFGNDDIVAHLLIEGTTINYAVVQGNDNRFYVNHDIWGNPSASGWIFLDYEADIFGKDHNLIIYGHNMRHNHKFHEIRHFADYSFFRRHPLIILTTPAGVMYWDIFAFYRTDIYFAYNHVNFSDENREYMFAQFINKSWHYAGITPAPHDRILTLSTCTGRNNNERYVLQARLRDIR